MDDTLKRVRDFLLLLALGIIVFFIGGYWAIESHQVRTAIKIATPLTILAILLAGRRSDRLSPHWDRLLVGFLAASCGFLASWLVGDLVARFLSTEIDSVRDIALLKVMDAVPILIVAFVVARVGGIRASELYLGKGRIKAWLTIGLASLALFLVLFLLQARQQGIKSSQVFAYAPWTALFVMSNGLMEEFHFRGLLLRSATGLLGPHAANLCIALFFALVHAPTQYTPDIVAFLAITFSLGLIWGYLIQKTDAIWGAVLFHAGADLVVIVGIFQTYSAI